MHNSVMIDINRYATHAKVVHANWPSQKENCILDRHRRKKEIRAKLA